MAVGSIQPFAAGVTVTLSASTTSAESALTGNGDAALIYNSTGSVAFVRFGADASVVATTADFPIPAGATRLVSITSLVQSVATILASGTGSVYVTRGYGTTY